MNYGKRLVEMSFDRIGREKREVWGKSVFNALCICMKLLEKNNYFVISKFMNFKVWKQLFRLKKRIVGNLCVYFGKFIFFGYC